MSNADIAAAVIARARTNSGLTAAAFDYDIAVNYDRSINGRGGIHSPLGVATYEIANEGHAGYHGEREARALQLWNDLQDELTDYARKCRDRRYTGWSNAEKAMGARIEYAR